MSALADIRTAIVATMNTVPDIGLVHRYERYAKLQNKFRTLYVTGGEVRGWYVRRTATRETSPGRGRYVVVHDWLIRGFMALDDLAATEETFDALIEAARDAFRADETLGGVIAGTNVDNRAGAQVTESVPVMFAGVLCHSARLALTTRHFQ